MVPNLNSSFISYELSPEQFKSGVMFTSDQKAVIQNMIATAAEEKIALTYDPAEPYKFQQREAELTGQIGILKYLLSLESQTTSQLQE